MSIAYRIGAGGASTTDLGDVVWLGDLPGATSRADGSVGMSGVEIQDPGGALDIPGLNKFEITESACSNTRIFTGIVADRTVSRGEYTTGAARVWDTNLADQNAYLSLRIIHDGNSGNRPAETDVARVAWLLASVLNNGHVQNGTGGLFGANGPTAAVLAAPRNLDAADYRGQYASDVLADIAPPGNRRFFTYWDPTLAKVCLFYGLNTDYLANSTLRISNVAADASSVTFAPFQDAALDRDPSAVYGAVYYKYRNGVIYREDASTLSAFLDRGVAISNDRVGLAATASTFVDRILDKAGTERDEIAVTIRIPKAQVNLVLEGMRIQVKFSHLPGYESFVYMHVLARTVMQDVENNDFYNVRLELCDYVGGFGTGGSGSGGGGSVGAPPFVPSPPAAIVSLTEGVLENGGAPGTLVSGSFSLEAGRPYKLDIRLSANTSGRVTLDCATPASQPINDAILAGVLTHTKDVTTDLLARSGCTVMITSDSGQTMTTHATDAGSVYYTDVASGGSAPSIGQLTTESLAGVAAGVDYTLNYPYVSGSLKVTVNGAAVTPTQVSPAAGTFELGFDATGSTVIVSYQIDSTTTTGSTNPQPTATASMPATLTVKDEGSALATAATSLDFVGSGVTATGAGAAKTITIPGSSGIVVKDEGSTLATDATSLDFVGAGVVASGAGAAKTITIAGGSGGLTLPNIIQAATASGGGGIGAMTFATAPVSGNTLYWISVHNGNGPTSITQTNVTWTQRRAGAVGGVGDMDIWTGVVSGTGGTTATAAGTSGNGSALAIEVSGYAYSSLGTGSIYETQSGATNRTTGSLVVPAGRIVACLFHTSGSTAIGPAVMSCPAIWGDNVGAVGALAFGTTVVAGPVRAYYETGGTYNTLADIVPA